MSVVKHYVNIRWRPNKNLQKKYDHLLLLQGFETKLTSCKALLSIVEAEYIS